jgi:mono/diheme cytochrome c family protein
MAAYIRRCALVLLGLAVLPVQASMELGSDTQRAEGRELYDKYCAQCHGIEGDAEAYATTRVKPAPRDFTTGKFKFRTTPTGMLPTDQDLVNVIRDGLPYTSMPGWPMFTDQQVLNIIYHIKTFSEDWSNPDKHAEPIAIPDPPEMSEDSIARGKEVYELQGCKACHGVLGRGDGLSAPTLKDEWGAHIRAADLTQRWTFRGGPTRTDIFRTFSTGVNGTPMPSYFDSVSELDRWHLTNFIYTMGESDGPNYANLLIVKPIDAELDLESHDELFADAPPVRFPLLGQIIQPGRDFYPSVTSLQVQAVYNRSEIAFRIRWSDLRAETAGQNGPALEAALWDDELPDAATEDEGGGDGFWGDEVAEEDAGSVWGDELVEEADEGDIWGEDAVAEEDDFWGEGEEDTAAAAGAAGFSDAVALQFPTQMPRGVRKPYFLSGDLEQAVDLWFVDLADGRGRLFTGRGADSIEPSRADEIVTAAEYVDGEWTVLLKRELRSRSGITFDENAYIPIAFSVWDGFNNERGNKRAVSQWLFLYTEPREVVSAVGPMVRAALITVAIELLIVFFIRRRHTKIPARASDAPAGAAVPPGQAAG